MTRPLISTIVATVATMSLAACGGGSSGGPLDAPGGQAPSPSDTIKIGSGNFSESTLLAEIYAGALQAKGVKVERTPPLGSRETYIPALKDGSIDLIPEYTGTLLQYLNPQAPQTASDEVYAALLQAVPPPLIVLDKSSAEDKDAVVVSKDTAQRYNVKSIADLAPHCGELVFGGPSEFATRPDGVPGIQKTYNCTFKSYRPLDTGPVTIKALEDGTVQAADIFTTNAAIRDKGFVVLEDPQNNFAAQNVLPLLNSAKATDQVKQVLNDVSAKLSTETLIELNAKVNAPDKPNLSTVANDWLAANGLN